MGRSEGYVAEVAKNLYINTKLLKIGLAVSLLVIAGLVTLLLMARNELSSLRGQVSVFEKTHGNIHSAEFEIRGLNGEKNQMLGFSVCCTELYPVKTSFEPKSGKGQLIWCGPSVIHVPFSDGGRQPVLVKINAEYEGCHQITLGLPSS